MRSVFTDAGYGNRVTALLSAVASANDAILRAASAQHIHQQVCDALASNGQVAAAAVIVCADLGELSFVAAAGDAIAHLRAQIASLGETPHEKEPLLRALRTWRPAVDKKHACLHCETPDDLAEVALPIVCEHQIAGVLLLHVREPLLLSDKVIDLLERTTQNLAFSIDRFASAELSASRGRTNRRLAGMYSALSAINEAILRARSVAELLQLTCDATVTHARSVACAKLLLGDGDRLQVAAEAGNLCELLGQDRFSIHSANEFGNGPWADAFQTKRLVIGDKPIDGNAGHSDTNKACVATPLICHGTCVGVSVYLVSRAWLADTEVVGLIERIVANLRFALEKFDEEAKRRQAESRIEYLATHDTLTGLVNRAKFSVQLEKALTRTANGELIAVHLLDLDRFKNVNDTLGHLQ